MTTRIKLRRDTAANWLAANPILAAGEPGLETDTGKVKYGDGETAYALLPHAGGDTLTDDGSVVVTAGSTAHWIATQRRDGYNTEPRGLRYDSQGNLYALTRGEEAQDSITVITKYTAAGAVAWQKSFTQVEPNSLAIDSSDRAYITVSDGDPEITVIKFSATGDILWKKSYDIGPLPVYSAFIEEKSSTTLALVAQAADGGGPPQSVLVLEISSTDGSVLLKKTLELESLELTVVAGIDVDSDENVFVTGYYYDVEPNLYKMFIEKLDQNFNRVWSKTLEAPDGYNMNGGDCASDAQGNIYAVGSYEVKTVNAEDGTVTKSAAILTKLNSSGVIQWTRRIGPGPCGGFIVGLTATDVGDVYLSSTTYENKTDGFFEEAPEFIQEAFRTSKQIVARYNTQGAVIWQRYVDVVNLNEESSDFDRGQAVAVFGNKFAVDGYGFSTNNAGGAESSETGDDERDYFVVQLPTDGTELTIGNLSFTESRVPGRFVTHEAVNSSLIVANYSETILAEDSEITADAEARIANNIVKSEAYSYTFGADGTLTIPNDGDIKLTQSQVGYLMAVDVDANDDITGRATCVDSQGYLYFGGQDDDGTNEPFVMKISPTGDRIWGVIISEDGGNSGRVNALSINPTTGNLMVLAEMTDQYDYSILFTLDQDTGRILSHQKFSDTGSDVNLVDIAWTSTGTYVLGGWKDGEFSAELPVTPQTGSTTGTIRVLRSALPAEPSTSWQIGGTGITPFETIAYVERYTGLTGTTRTGSGATFDITNNGNGTYSASVVNGGTNYRVGHKIKILGTDLGGLTPDNDCIITVQSVDGGGVIQGGGVGNSGTAAAVGSGGTLVYTPTNKSATIQSDSSISFKTDGTKFYEFTNGIIYEYTLGTAWDVSTVSGSIDRDISTLFGSNTIRRGLHFNPNGTEFYVVEIDDSAFNADYYLSKITLSVPWDITSTLSRVQGGRGGSGYGAGLTLSDDGTKFYFCIGGNVRQWNLSTAWDISSVDDTPNATYNFSSDNYSPRDIAFSQDGTSAYITTYEPADPYHEIIVRYDLGTAWDISTAVVTTDIINMRTSLGVTYIDGSSITFSPDRSKMYVSAFQGFSTQKVFQLNSAVGTIYNSQFTYNATGTYGAMGTSFSNLAPNVWNVQTFGWFGDMDKYNTVTGFTSGTPFTMGFRGTTYSGTLTSDFIAPEGSTTSKEATVSWTGSAPTVSSYDSPNWFSIGGTRYENRYTEQTTYDYAGLAGVNASTTQLRIDGNSNANNNSIWADTTEFDNIIAATTGAEITVVYQGNTYVGTLSSGFTETDPVNQAERYFASITWQSSSGLETFPMPVDSIILPSSGGGSTSYTAQSGANHQVGSGFTMTLRGPFADNDYNNYFDRSITANGSNYVNGDVIVIPGTSLGGASTANDLTISLFVDESNFYINSMSGTAQSTTWKLETTTQVDFGGTGSWSLTYPTRQEGLLVTPNWQRTFNTSADVDDYIDSVAVDSNDNIISVGKGRGELNTGNFRDLALVFKFNSSGALQWVRQLNEVGDHCYGQSVITIGTDIYVTHDSNDDGDTVITKLDTTGTVKWQRRTQAGDDTCIARTANGNLMVIAEELYNPIDENAIKVFQLTASGETVYKRWLLAHTDDATRLASARGLCTDNHSFYIGAYYDNNNSDDSGLAVRLPIDGSGTGNYGSFRYVDVNPETNNFSGNDLSNDNYSIVTINIEAENNYAGALAVAPTVSTGTAVTTGTGDFYVDSWYPDLVIEPVHDTDGGSIVFADGSTQSTSATDIPQRRYNGQRYTLSLKDRGHHILCDISDENIIIPYYSRVPFPVGSVITIVNTSDSSIGINVEGQSTSVMLAGEGNYSFYLIQAYGVVTLLNIGPDRWVISGNVNPD